LIVVGTNSQAVSISPYSGRILGQIELPDGVDLPPVVANGTVYVFTSEGDLVALR
jgi:outer membrane protein assembly factor BamB